MEGEFKLAVFKNKYLDYAYEEKSGIFTYKSYTAQCTLEELSAYVRIATLLYPQYGYMCLTPQPLSVPCEYNEIRAAEMMRGVLMADDQYCRVFFDMSEEKMITFRIFTQARICGGNIDYRYLAKRYEYKDLAVYRRRVDDDEESYEIRLLSSPLEGYQHMWSVTDGPPPSVIRELVNICMYGYFKYNY